MGLLERLSRLLGAESQRRGQMLGGFVDSLIQMFENCRAGLGDEALAGGDAAFRFFEDLYQKERGRLREVIAQQERHLPDAARAELFEKVDERIRRVVLPAYVRLASPFTRRERNDFYLLPEPLHGLERLSWAVAGMGLGAFVVWTPFIPLWSKEWVLPFTLAGLVFPDVRRFLGLRRYQAELNSLVAKTDNEIWRMDLAYLTGDLARGPSESATTAPQAAETDDDDGERLRARLRAEADERGPDDLRPRGRHKQGGR